VTSEVDVSCSRGLSWELSSSATRGKEGCDMGESGGGRKSRGRMLRVDNGGNTDGRAKEVVEGGRIVISMAESLCGWGASGCENKRPVSATPREVDGIAEATERLRPFFTPNCHLRTLPLELARRARDTAFFTNPSRGLGPADLVELGLDEGRGDGLEDEDGRDVDGDSSSSVSIALPSSKAICVRSSDN